MTTADKSGLKIAVEATNRLWSDDEIQARWDGAEMRPEDQFPPLPKEGRAQMEARQRDAVGDVVSGVAAVDGTFIVRTGTELYCVRAGE